MKCIKSAHRKHAFWAVNWAARFSLFSHYLPNRPLSLQQNALLLEKRFLKLNADSASQSDIGLSVCTLKPDSLGISKMNMSKVERLVLEWRCWALIAFFGSKFGRCNGGHTSRCKERISQYRSEPLLPTYGTLLELSWSCLFLKWNRLHLNFEPRSSAKSGHFQSASSPKNRDAAFLRGHRMSEKSKSNSLKRPRLSWNIQEVLNEQFNGKSQTLDYESQAVGKSFKVWNSKFKNFFKTSIKSESVFGVLNSIFQAPLGCALPNR